MPVDAHPLAQRTQVKAWDVPTRLFHWTLVALIAGAWATFEYAEALGDPTLRWHRWNGYAILVLLLFRLIWGIAGSSTAKFSSFVRSPVAAARYGFDLLRGRPRHFLGHNPLGAWMVLALMLAVGAQGVLGLFTVEHNDLTAGPLYRLVSEPTWKLLSKWHVWMFTGLILPLIAIHVAANVLYSLVKREPLIRAMVTGHKPAAGYEDVTEVRLAPNTPLRATLAIAAAAALLLGGLLVSGGRL